MPSGICSFPAVTFVQSAEAVLANGFEPSCIFVRCLPQSTPISETGDLVIGWNGFNAVISQCLVDKASIQFTTQGQVCGVRLLDRRWVWRTQIIHGRYNIRLANGEVSSSNRKTPQQLAILLLTQMGDGGADVSALPNDGYPFADWVYANAKDELERLCSERGCTISAPSVIDNTVRIVQIGNGSLLPTDDAQTVSYSVDAADVPQQLLLFTDETVVQSKLKLEAVGLDSDNTVKKINNLSYKPTGGWKESNLDEMLSVTDVEARRNAVKTVYRWYRIVSQADGTQDVPVIGSVASIRQLLPISTELISLANEVEGDDQPRRAYIEGTFLPGGDVSSKVNSDPFTLYEGRYRINEETGIVVFAEPVVKLDSTKKFFEPAELYLTCTYGVTSPTTNQEHRYTRTLSLGGSSANGEIAIPVEDFRGVIVAVYGSDKKTVSSTINNESTLDTMSDALLASYAYRITNRASAMAKYAGIKPIANDGAIVQTVYLFDQFKGWHTIAYRNCELHPFVPTLQQRQQSRIIRDNSRVTGARLRSWVQRRRGFS